MANKNTNPGGGKNADSGVMHNPQPSRARTRGMSYGDINNIPLSVIPRACAHARVVRTTGILKESLLDLPGARTRTRGER